jgi:hypothetical protein
LVQFAYLASMRRLGPSLFVVIISAAVPRPGPAQLHATADVGAAVLRQSGLAESGALLLGSELQNSWSRGAVSSTVLAARAADGRWTGQEVTTASIFGPARGRARWELGTTVSGFGSSHDRLAASAQIVAREYVGRSRGVFIGAGGGAIAQDGINLPATVGQVGAWLRSESDQLVAGVTMIGTQSTDRHSLRFADVNAGWQRDSRVLALAFAGGARLGLSGITGSTGWASATATAWLTPRFALVGSAGRSLDDVVRGVPAVQYASVAMRVALRSRSSAAPPRDQRRDGPRLRVTTSEAGERSIEITADDATTVELMADFTGWAPVSLVSSGGVWRLDRQIAAGPHRVVVRIDGGEWRVPPNLPHSTDDLGGTVGLITIP